MEKLRRHIGFVASITALVGISSAQNCFATVDEEVARQAARQISEAISRRVTQSVLPTGDLTSMPDAVNAWGTFSYTSLAATRGLFNVDVGQFVIGADQRFGDFFFGGSVSYARAESGAFQSDLGIDSPSISAYIAYLFNQNVFANAILGYGYSDLESKTRRLASFSAATHAPFSDISLNGVLPIENWILKAKAGHRLLGAFNDDVEFTFLSQRPVSFAVDDTYTNTVYGTGEVGYRVQQFTPYFRFTVEEIIPELGDDLQSVFIAAGVNYEFSNFFTAGLSYQRELNNDDLIEYNQAALDIRLKF